MSCKKDLLLGHSHFCNFSSASGISKYHVKSVGIAGVTYVTFFFEILVD